MKYLVYISVLLLVIACKKPENRSCWKSRGSEAIRHVDLPDFDRLELKKGIAYVLVQDSTNYLEIYGGKNLLNFIEYSEIDNKKIRIENKNKCNFLRKYSSTIRVEIHFRELRELRFEGTEKISNRDTLQLDEFKFEVIDACGSVNFVLKANKVIADVPFGFGDYTLSGIVDAAELSVRSNGYCNTENLRVLSNLKVSNASPGDMYINADQLNVTGNIVGAGNIYYKGNLLSNEVAYFSTGRMIKN